MAKAQQKERIGTVISAKMQKTVIVKVTSRVKHPKYGKVLTHRSTFKVHDEKSVAKAGDVVRIRETRPLSKDKHFRLLEVVKKAQISSVKPEELDPTVTPDAPNQ